MTQLPSDQIVACNQALSKVLDADNVVASLTERIASAIEHVIQSSNANLELVNAIITPRIIPELSEKCLKTRGAYVPQPPKRPPHNVPPYRIVVTTSKWRQHAEALDSMKASMRASTQPPHPPVMATNDPEIESHLVPVSRAPKPPKVLTMQRTSVERIGSNLTPSAGSLSPVRMHAMSLGRCNTYHVTPPTLPTDVVTPCSSFPLELFDVLEYRLQSRELFDRLRRGERIQACSRYTRDGVTMWEDCEIMDCDEHTNRFMVEWVESKNYKLVTRFNLMVRGEETLEECECRIAAAMMERELFEAMFRSQLWLESIVVDHERLLSPNVIHRIAEKGKIGSTWSQRRTSTSRSIENNRNMEDEQKEIIKEIEEEYASAMRLATITYHALDPTVQQALNLVKITVPKIPTSRNPQRKIDIPGYTRASYEEAKSNVTKSLYLLVKPLQEALLEINALWFKVRPNVEMLQLEYNMPQVLEFKLRVSIDIREFISQQKQQIQKAHKKLVLMYLASVDNVLVSHIINCFPHAYVDNSHYNKSHLKRFLSIVNFMMSTRLQELVSECVKKYALYFTTFRPLKKPQISRNFTVPVESPSVPPGRLLLRIQLQIDTTNHAIVMSPSLRNVEKDLLDIIDQAAITGASVDHIEASYLSCVDVEHKFLPCLDLKHPVLVQARHDIATALHKDLPSLNNLLATYNKFASMLDPSMNSTEEVLFDPKNPKDVTILDAQLPALLRALDDIEKLSPADVTIGMFLVECGEAKEALLDACKSRFQSAVDVVANKMRLTCTTINNSFEELFKFIQERPSSPEAWTNAKQFVLDRKADLEGLRANEFYTMLSYMETLDRHGMATPEDVRDLMFGMQQWPAIIEVCLQRNDHMWNRERNEFIVMLEQNRIDIQKELDRITREMSVFFQESNFEKVDEYATRAKKLDASLKAITSSVELLNQREVLFGLDESHFKQLAEATKVFQPFLSVWTTASEWVGRYPMYLDGPFCGLNANEIVEDTSRWRRELRQSSFPLRAYPGVYKVCQKVQGEIANFQEFVPVIEVLRSDYLRTSHWKELSKMLGLEINPNDPSFTVSQLLTLSVKSFEAEIFGLCNRATQEFEIESQLDRMRAELKSTRIRIESKRRGVPLLLDPPDLINVLDRQLTNTQHLRRNPCVLPFASQCREWENELVVTLEILTIWADLQRQYLLLVPLLSMASSTDRAELEEVFKLFSYVDQRWKEVLHDVDRYASNLYSLMSHAELVNHFKDIRIHLMKLQMDVSYLLDFKRNVFPRLYFVTDEEFLDILAAPNDPKYLQPLFPRLFSDLSRVEMEVNQTNNTISAVISHDSVRLVLHRPIETDNVEISQWLRELEVGIKKTLKSTLAIAAHEYKHQSRRIWMFKWTGQIVSLVHQIMMTQELEEVLPLSGRKGLLAYNRKITRQLNDLWEIVPMLNKLKLRDRDTFAVFLQAELFHRDVIDHLIQCSVSDKKDLEYDQTIRHYLVGEDNVELRTLSLSVDYGFEFISTLSPWSMTPTTVSLMRSLLSMVAIKHNPLVYGPINTGKSALLTELASLCGRHLIDVSCSDKSDVGTLRRVVKGSLLSGSWVLLHNIHLLQPEALNCITQALQNVWYQQRNDVPFELGDGRAVKLTSKFCFLATSETAASLPQNVTACFRPFACLQAEGVYIAQTLLQSLGFSNPQVLGVKLYKAVEMLGALSNNIRPMTCLNRVITMLRAAVLPLNSSLEIEQSHIRSCLDFLALNTLDAATVNIVLDPIFGKSTPEITSSLQPNPDVLEALKVSLPTAFLNVGVGMEVAAELGSTLVVVGSTASGKTSLLMTLHKCRGSGVVPIHVFPGSYSSDQIFGKWHYVSSSEKRWQRSIFEYIAAQVDQSSFNEQPLTIIFDGKLNDTMCGILSSTVADKRKMECISGKVVRLTLQSLVVFETTDVSSCTPAFASRCSLFYVPENTFTPIQRIEHDMRKVPQLETYLPRVEICIHKFIPQLSEYMITHVKKSQEIIVWCAKSFVTVFEAAVALTGDSDMSFVYAIVNSFGSYFITTSDRHYFQQAVLEGFAELEAQEDFVHSEHALPEDFFSCALSEHGWVSNTDFKEFPSNLDIMVTPDSASSFQLQYLLMRSKKHSIVLGPDGSRKTTLLNFCQAMQPPGMHVATFISGTSSLGNQTLWHSIHFIVSKHGENTYNLGGEVNLHVYIDDLHLTDTNEITHTLQVSEWCRSYAHSTTMLSTLHGFIQLLDVALHVSATEGTLQTREMNHFVPIYVRPPTSNTLELIARRTLLDSVQDEPSKRLATCFLRMHDDVSQKWRLDSSKPKYCFSVHSLMRLASSLRGYSADVIIQKKMMRDALGYEMWRAYGDTVTEEEDVKWLNDCIANVLSQTLQLPVSDAVFFPQQVMLSSLCSTNIREGKKETDLQAIPTEQVIEKIKKAVGRFWDRLFVGEGDSQLRNPLFTIFPPIITPVNVQYFAALTDVLSVNGACVVVQGTASEGIVNMIPFVCSLLGYQTTTLQANAMVDDTHSLEEIKRLQKHVVKTATVPVVLIVPEYQFLSNFMQGCVNSLMNGQLVSMCYENEEWFKLTGSFGKDEEHRTDAIGNALGKQLRVVVVVDKDSESKVTVPNHCTRLVANYMGPEYVTQLVRSINEYEVAIKDVQLPHALAALSAFTQSHSEHSIVSFLTLFRNIYNAHMKKLKQRYTSHADCLDKIVTMQVIHKNLVAEVNELTPTAKQLETSINALQNHITSELKRLDKLRQEYQDLEEECMNLATQVESHKHTITTDLETNIPAVKSAREKVMTVTEGEVAFLRSYTAPPPSMKKAFEALCYVLNEKIDSSNRSAGTELWNHAKKVMDDKNFIKRLAEVPEECLDPPSMEKVDEIVNDPKFSVQKLFHINPTIAAIAQYIVALNGFHKMLKMIGPLKQELATKEDILHRIVHRFEELREFINAREKTVSNSVQQLEQFRAERKVLIDKLEASERRVRIVANLAGQLTASENKWKENKAALEVSLNTVVGDSALAALMVSQGGSLNHSMRQSLITQCVEILESHRLRVTQPYEIHRVINNVEDGMDAQVHAIFNSYTNHENFFCTNYALVFQPYLIPLVIDKYSLCFDFLTRRYGQNGYRMISSTSSEIESTMARCASKGHALIINIEDTVTPFLHQLAHEHSRDNLYNTNPARLSKVRTIGGQSIEVHKTFRVFFRTENERFLSTVSAKFLSNVAVVNYDHSESLGAALSLRITQNSKSRCAATYTEVMNSAVSLLTRITGAAKARDEVMSRINTFEKLIDDETAATEFITEIGLSEKLWRRIERGFVSLEEQREARDNNWKKVGRAIANVVLTVEKFMRPPFMPAVSPAMINKIIAASFEASKRTKQLLGNRQMDNIQLDELRWLFTCNFLQHFLNISTAQLSRQERLACVTLCLLHTRKDLGVANVPLLDIGISEYELGLILNQHNGGSDSSGSTTSASVSGPPAPPPAQSQFILSPSMTTVVKIDPPKDIPASSWFNFVALCSTNRSLDYLPAEISKNIEDWEPFLFARKGNIALDAPDTSRGRLPIFQQLLVSRYLSYHFASHVERFLRKYSENVLQVPEPHNDPVGVLSAFSNSFVLLPQKGMDAWLEVTRLAKKSNLFVLSLFLEPTDTMLEINTRITRLIAQDLMLPFTGRNLFVNLPDTTPKWLKFIPLINEVVTQGLKNNVPGMQSLQAIWFSFSHCTNPTLLIPVMQRCILVRWEDVGENYSKDLARATECVTDALGWMRDKEKRAEVTEALSKLPSYHTLLVHTERRFGQWYSVFDNCIAEGDLEVFAHTMRHVVMSKGSQVTPLMIANTIVYAPRCINVFDKVRRMKLAKERMPNLMNQSIRAAEFDGSNSVMFSRSASVRVPTISLTTSMSQATQNSTSTQPTPPPPPVEYDSDGDAITSVTMPGIVFWSHSEWSRRQEMIRALEGDYTTETAQHGSDFFVSFGVLSSFPKLVVDNSTLQPTTTKSNSQQKHQQVGSVSLILARRSAFLQDWSPNSTVPVPLGQIPDAGSFIKALLFDHSVKMGQPATEYIIEALKLVSMPATIDSGCLVSGAVFVGMDVDNDGTVFPPGDEDIMYVDVPFLWLRFVPKKHSVPRITNTNDLLPSHPYEVPLIRMSSRPQGNPADYTRNGGRSGEIIWPSLSMMKSDSDVEWFRNVQTIFVFGKG
eukprot:PhF_6_TR38625/c0_g1_i3/m.57616/K10408/DNAH; dynein heavy chain, axonemal